jgi:hypothetical protein
MDTQVEVADSWKQDCCYGINRHVHGYASGSCRLLETRLLLRNQQTCPWIRKWKLQTLGNKTVASESTDVSMDTTKQQTSPRIPKNIKIRIYKNIICLWFCMGVKLGF